MSERASERLASSVLLCALYVSVGVHVPVRRGGGRVSVHAGAAAKPRPSVVVLVDSRDAESEEKAHTREDEVDNVLMSM